MKRSQGQAQGFNNNVAYSLSHSVMSVPAVTNKQTDAPLTQNVSAQSAQMREKPSSSIKGL